MDRDKIRAKVLNMIDHASLEPASLAKQPSHQARNNPRHPLSMSKSTISRQSYLDSPEHKYNQPSKQIQVSGKSVSKSKKKRYLNIVTDPHSQSLHKLRKENIVLVQNKLTLSRVSGVSKAENKNEQMDDSSANQKKLTRNNSIKSVLSIEIPSQKTRNNQNITERVIVKEKIVPVLIHSNQNAPFLHKQQLLPSRPNLKIEHNPYHNTLINKKLNLQSQPIAKMRPPIHSIHLQPQTHIDLPQQQHISFSNQHLHLPQQLVNLQVRESQIKLAHPQSYILQSHRSKREDISNQHQTTTEFFIPTNETPRPVQISQNAHRAVINPAIATPIRAYSPSENSFTPIQIIQRGSLQKRQNVLNQQIVQKLGSIQLSKGVYHNPAYEVHNQQQKVLKIISDSHNNNPYPTIRTISKKQLNPAEVSPQARATNTAIVNLSFCPNTSIETPQRQKDISDCQIPMKFLNTPNRSAKKQSKHTLKHSPKPIREKEVSSKSIDLSHDLQMMSRKSPRQSIKSEVSSKSKQSVNKSSFFAETKGSNIMARQNTFLINIRAELEQIQQKRRQSESRISRRLQQLSQRTSSLVKICEEDLRSPINRTVLSLSHRNNTCLQQSFCSKQNEIKQNFTSKKSSVQLNLKLNKQNQQQGIFLREQIMSRIFS